MRLVRIQFRQKLDQVIKLHVQIIIDSDEPIVFISDAREVRQELGKG